MHTFNEKKVAAVFFRPFTAQLSFSAVTNATGVNVTSTNTTTAMNTTTIRWRRYGVRGRRVNCCSWRRIYVTTTASCYYLYLFFLCASTLSIPKTPLSITYFLKESTKMNRYRCGFGGSRTNGSSKKRLKNTDMNLAIKFSVERIELPC